jgi:hypothetical protein
LGLIWPGRAERVPEEPPSLATNFAEVARTWGKAHLEAHCRIRKTSRASGVMHRVEPKLPVDVLGVYVYLPGGA